MFYHWDSSPAWNYTLDTPLTEHLTLPCTAVGTSWSREQDMGTLASSGSSCGKTSQRWQSYRPYGIRFLSRCGQNLLMFVTWERGGDWVRWHEKQDGRTSNAMFFSIAEKRKLMRMSDLAFRPWRTSWDINWNPNSYFYFVIVKEMQI